MAFGMNHTRIIGRLGADPDAKFTKTGKPITAFRVAVNARSGGDEIRQSEHRTGGDGRTYAYRPPTRKLGELPEAGLAERARAMLGGDREQRRSVSYVARLLTPLDDLYADAMAWESAGDIAAACRAVWKPGDVAGRAGRLSRATSTLLAVALALGYQDGDGDE